MIQHDSSLWLRPPARAALGLLKRTASSSLGGSNPSANLLSRSGFAWKRIPQFRRFANGLSLSIWGRGSGWQIFGPAQAIVKPCFLLMTNAKRLLSSSAALNIGSRHTTCRVGCDTALNWQLAASAARAPYQRKAHLLDTLYRYSGCHHLYASLPAELVEQTLVKQEGAHVLT